MKYESKEYRCRSLSDVINAIDAYLKENGLSREIDIYYIDFTDLLYPVIIGYDEEMGLIIS